jgi:hypothetical protein
MSTTTVGAFSVRLEACRIGSLLPVNLLVFLAALTVLFSLVTWTAILFILLKECCEWGIRKIKGTKQASAKTADGEGYSSYRDAVKRFSP